MKNIILFLFALPMFAISQAEESKIRGIIDQYIYAWNAQHGRGFADHFANDADFINIFGTHFAGKEAVQERHNLIHDTFLKDSTFVAESVEVREVNPTVVMAFVTWKVSGKDPFGTKRGIFSHTFVKEKDSWIIVATQNTLIK